MRSALLVAVAAGLLVAPLHGEPHQHPQRPGHDTQQAEDSQGRPQAPVLVKLLNTGKSDSEAAQEREQARKRENTDAWSVLFTAIIAGVGVLQLLAFLGQKRALERTIEQAKAAEERQFRAYVFPYEPKLSQIGPGWPIHVKVGVKNYGNTPASRVRCDVQLLMREFPPTEVPQLGHVPEPTAFTWLPQGATFGFSHSLSGTLSQAQIQAMGEGTCAIYLVGRITYLDVFQRRQTTDFLLFHNGSLERMGVHGQGVMMFYREGNSAT